MWRPFRFVNYGHHLLGLDGLGNRLQTAWSAGSNRCREQQLGQNAPFKMDAIFCYSFNLGKYPFAPLSQAQTNQNNHFLRRCLQSIDGFCSTEVLCQ